MRVLKRLGDILIQRVRLPLPRSGDLIAIPSAGAYQLAMASNYNLAPRPAVVIVAGGTARLVRRRETNDDLLRNDIDDGPTARVPTSGPSAAR